MRKVHRTVAAAAITAAAGLALLAPPASAAPTTFSATAAAAKCPLVGTKYPHYTNPKVGDFVYDTSLPIGLCSPGFGTGDHFELTNKHASGISGWSAEITKVPRSHYQYLAMPAYNGGVRESSAYGLDQRLYVKYSFGGHVYTFDYQTS